MQHHRLFAGIVLCHVLHLETLREVEVDLDRTALPFTPERIGDLHIDLRPVEGTAALVDRIRQVVLLKRIFEPLCRQFPYRILADRLLRLRRDLHRIVKPEELHHAVDELHDLDHL